MSFPRYPRYKQSGVDWLGEVPAHWEVVPLKHVAEFVNGAVFKPTEWRESGVPIIRIENLNGGEEFNCFDGEIDPRHAVAEGDLLFGWSGNRGTSFGPFIWKRPGQFVLNQHIFRVAPYQTPADCLYWTLKAVTSHVEERAHGIIGMVHVTKGELGSTAVPMPPTEEHRAISLFLDQETHKIDVLISEQQRLIELLREKQHAVISHAVTKGLDPDAPMKDSGVEWLGEVPAHWEVIRLGRKISLQRGVDITKDQQTPGDVPVVSSGGVTSWHDKALAPGPGVLVGRKGSAGTVHYVECAYWPHDTTLYVKDFGGNVPRFIYYKLEAMDLASYDTGSSNPTINRNLVHPVHVPWPPPEEQNEIAQFLDAQEAMISGLSAAATRAITLLQERRTALISAAVTGKIDVRSYTETA